MENEEGFIEQDDRWSGAAVTWCGVPSLDQHRQVPSYSGHPKYLCQETCMISEQKVLEAILLTVPLVFLHTVNQSLPPPSPPPPGCDVGKSDELFSCVSLVMLHKLSQ